MTSKKSIKNKVVGKLKQVEGKITKDKVREACLLYTSRCV